MAVHRRVASTYRITVPARWFEEEIGRNAEFPWEDLCHETVCAAHSSRLRAHLAGGGRTGPAVPCWPDKSRGSACPGRRCRHCRARPWRKYLETAEDAGYPDQSSRRWRRGRHQRRSPGKKGRPHDSVCAKQRAYLSCRSPTQIRHLRCAPGSGATRHHLTHTDHPRRAQRRTVQKLRRVHRALEEKAGPYAHWSPWLRLSR